jgi:hypothetical protein
MVATVAQVLLVEMMALAVVAAAAQWGATLQV